MNSGTNPKNQSFFVKIGILVGFIIEVVNQILYELSESELQHWIGKKEAIRKQLREMFQITDLYIEEREFWRKFYQKHFAMNLNFSDILIPEKPAKGKWRLLIIAEGLGLNQVFARMKKIFDCWKYWDNLDGEIFKNARNTKKSYTVWVRSEVEPDSEYVGKSTNQADPNMAIGVTLLERMIHEIVYFDETGNHLDIKGVTFCTGSRSSEGRVPGLCWLPVYRRVEVDWCGLGYANGAYGLRQAVYS